MEYKPFPIMPVAIYGTDNPPIPDGYVETGEFRPPRQGEFYFGTLGSIETATAKSEEYLKKVNGARIILTKLERRRIILTEVRVGYPKIGEYFEDGCGYGPRLALINYDEYNWTHCGGKPTRIYKRTDETF